MLQSHQIVIFLVFQHRHTRLSNKWHSDMISMCFQHKIDKCKWQWICVDWPSACRKKPISAAKTDFPQAGRCFGCQFSYIKWPCCPLGERRRPGAYLFQKVVAKTKTPFHVTFRICGRLQTLCPCRVMIPSPRVKDKIYQNINVKIRQNWFSPTLTHKKDLNFTCWVHVASRNSFLVGYFFGPPKADILEADQASTVAAKTSMSTLDLLTVL